MCLRLLEGLRNPRPEYNEIAESSSGTPYSFYPISHCLPAVEYEWSFRLAKFEDCLQRLEKVVQELEKGEVPLETSLTLFEEGMQLSASCRKELEEAEGKVEILLKQNGKLQAEPFDPLTDKASSRK